ncbi:helix-turn-helix domain-containing protein [Paenibacillus sp. S150]|uniref:helix-turn-helix domain-containing protein n=1 Tax=Paenibacillus sp. S150 TaxID=2749826 RepID=UPI001C56FBC0|nr:helix-turn-helix transcriptional regulator [Paenibacillus sp. S150]MBW4082405.1 helix-turn-helix transcriptional regulator [Paenibacillus sp. S150]
MSDNIGLIIRSLRKRVNISQSKLAEGICSQSEISKIENGLINPYVNTLYLISRKLEVNFNDFYEYLDSSAYKEIESFQSRIKEVVAAGNFSDAMQLIAEAKGLQSFEDAQMKQFLFWQEAVCYYLAKNIEQAFILCEQAFRAARKAELKEQDIEILISMERMYNGSLRSGTHITHLLNALNVVSEKLGAANYKLAVQALYHMARIYYGMQSLHEALHCCKRGVHICREHQTMINLGELMLLQGDCRQALGDLGAALKLYQYATLFFEATESAYAFNQAKTRIESLS